MRSLFTMSRYDRVGFMPIRRPALGQFEFAEDLAKDLGEQIGELITKLPPEIAGPYEARMAECQRQVAEGGGGIVSGGQCLYALFQEIKDRVESEGQISTTQPPIQTVKPPPSEFPWVPVGIAAGAGLLLLFALTR